MQCGKLSYPVFWRWKIIDTVGKSNDLWKALNSLGLPKCFKYKYAAAGRDNNSVLGFKRY